jgi:hypothetical protein
LDQYQDRLADVYWKALPASQNKGYFEFCMCQWLTMKDTAAIAIVIPGDIS